MYRFHYFELAAYHYNRSQDTFICDDEIKNKLDFSSFQWYTLQVVYMRLTVAELYTSIIRNRIEAFEQARYPIWNNAIIL